MRRVLFIMATMTFCIINAGASVDLQMGYYNSNDDTSMSLEGSNLNFGSTCTLLPQSIEYNNGGASIQPRTEYSYSLSLNGETAFSSAETDSGMFAFQGSVKAGGYKNDNLLKVSAKSGVKDGHLKTAYGNDEFMVQEEVEAENSVYEQRADLDPNSVSSTGFGSTLTPVPGLAENLMARSTGQAAPSTEDAGSSTTERREQGVEYSLQVQNVRDEREGYVDANVMGLTEAQLATQVKFGGEGYLFGTKMRGIGFAPIDDLSMEGQATGLPIQTLPPGDVEISYRDPPSSDEPEPWEEYTDLVDEESEKFDSEYPGESTPALWYYLNNEFQIEVPVYVYYPSYNPQEPVETYQLGMVYEGG